MSDPLFGVHAAALTLGRQRMDVLASNLANADTPHYQAKDIDFERALGAGARGAARARCIVAAGGDITGNDETFIIQIEQIGGERPAAGMTLAPFTVHDDSHTIHGCIP